MCSLGALGSGNSGFSSAVAVSADGKAVVGYGFVDNGDLQAFVWRDGYGQLMNLGTLRADNSGNSYADAVSADGSTVVGSAVNNTGNDEAFIWRDGYAKVRGLGTLRSDGSGNSAAVAVSADGSVVVGPSEHDVANFHAFVWREGDTKMVDLGTLRLNNVGDSYAVGVSADGSVITGNSDTDSSFVHAFIWRAGDTQLTDLGTLVSNGLGNSNAYAISADGSTVIGDAENDDRDHHVFAWWQGDNRMRDLGTLRSDNSGASLSGGISADGSVVVGGAQNDAGDIRAFIWRRGDVRMTDLGTFKSDQSGGSFASAISADGLTVVGSADNDANEYRAFIWRGDSAGMRDLGTLKSDNSGSASPLAISADGSTVVGFAETDSGDDHAFIWRTKTDIDGGEIQDLSHLLGSYVRLADQTEQAFRTQQRATGNMLEASCFAEETGSCIKVSGLVSGTPSDGSEGYSGIGRTTAAVGVLSYGYGMTRELTLGAIVGAHGGSLKHSGIDLNTGWSVGLFAQYSQSGKAHAGWQANAGVAYGTQNMDIVRGQGMANVQHAYGDKKLDTFAMRLGMGYGLELGNDWLVTPGAEVLYYHSSRDGYTESGKNLVFDTRYDSLSNNSTMLTLGVTAQKQVLERSQVLVGAGVEIDLDVDEVRLTGASNVFTLGNGTEGFESRTALDRNHSRPYVQAGYSYELPDNQGTFGAGARLWAPEYGDGSVQYTVGMSYGLSF